MTTEFVNRTASVVRPKQPYIDWADSFDDGGPKYDPDHHQAKVFQIDEVADTHDIKKVLNRYWQDIFEEELNSWMRDPNVWPNRRTLKVFLDWFEVEVCDLVLDLGKGAKRHCIAQYHVWGIQPKSIVRRGLQLKTNMYL